MARAGVIAVGIPRRWAGVYLKPPAYPLWVGDNVWGLLHKVVLEEFRRRYVFGHPGGWVHLPGECYCHYGAPAVLPPFASEEDYLQRGAPELPPFSSEHQRLSEVCDIGWVYVVDIEGNLLNVLYRDEGPLSFISAHDVDGPCPDWQRVMEDALRKVPPSPGQKTAKFLGARPADLFEMIRRYRGRNL